ncbi:alpha-1,4-N-acetylglucosaminyltransferase-like [Dendropsophus ebraccatus]|uniref:alpha-1,4-N-acetylglucosaminyltransferase-like n=1 Tax=Dendropsophus ebraccatus TaxID=150705 RepID=UPI0038312269
MSLSQNGCHRKAWGQQSLDLYCHTMTIPKDFRIFQFIVLLIGSGFLYKVIYQNSNVPYLSYIFTEGTGQYSLNENLLVPQEKSEHVSENTMEPIKSKRQGVEDILNKEDGVIFLETTDTMQPKPLVLCAVESAARVYQDRPVVFFMKGLTEMDLKDEENSLYKYFPTLSSLDNLYIFPLIADDIFTSTPLLSWYKKINPEKEIYWIHILADSCRLALIWKYGGIYMDTDIISLRPIPHENFLAAEYPRTSSNGAFGFSARHNFTWKCMEDFVQNYDGEIWGNQGPFLFTRVIRKLCDLPEFEGAEDISCGNISFLNPQRFYPIAYGYWRDLYAVWDPLPSFSDSFAVHLWNYMNQFENRTMVPGSNTLVEHLYKKHCPSTYGALQRNESIYL